MNGKEKTNMKKIDELAQEFRFKYEKFFIGCDAMEELGLWDKEKNGEMESFYQNDLVSVILRLSAIDGNISEKEVRFFNDVFGFRYSLEELKDVYESSREDIEELSDEEFRNGITLMRSVSVKLADAYRELLCLVCDIIIESDEIVDPAELKEARRLKDLFLS